MSWRLHIYPVFPRCAHDPLSACTPDQPANKLRNTGLKDTTCCCVALVVACGSAGFLGDVPGGPSGALHAGGGGGLHYIKPSGGVSPACRTLAWCNSPRLEAVRRCARQTADPLGENSQNRRFRRNGSALWRSRCQSRRAARTRTPEHAR